MFEKTRAVWERTQNDIRKITFPCQLITTSIMSLYFIYAIITQVGYFWANIPLLLLNIFYFGFLIGTNKEEDKSAKKKTTTVKKGLNAIKLSIKLLTLCASLYGLYVTAMNATLISIILTAFMIVGWLLSFILEIVNSIIVKRVDILMESLMNDVDIVINIINIFKKISKNDIVPIPNEYEQEIDEMLQEFLAKHGAVQPAPAPAPAPVAGAIAVAQAKPPKKKLFGRKNK